MYYCFELNEFPSITQFYRVTRNTVWEITDKDNIIIFIQEGKCSITYEKEEFLLEKGDIFFIPANHSYCRRPIDGTMCTMSYIHFSFSSEIVQTDFSELVEKITDTKTTLDNQILDGAPRLSKVNTLYLQNKNQLKDDKKTFQQLNDIRLFSASRQLMCGLQSSIILCSILSALSQNMIEQVLSDNILNKPSKIPDNLKKAIRYIRSHYTEPISLSDLALHCNLSKQQLIRYFKTAFHVTPTVYITEYKIARAKELLFNQPHLTIKEISDELGFDNQHYFTRVFIKVSGETPSHYRYRTTHFKELSKQNDAPSSHFFGTF